MSKAWQLQEAKNKLSEVIEKACNEGPQTITKHGESAVVVIAFAEYQLLRRQKEAPTLADFFAKSPLKGVPLDFTRDKSTGRKSFA